METNFEHMAGMCFDASYLWHLLGGVIGTEVRLLIDVVFTARLWACGGWRHGLLRHRLLVLIPDKVHLSRRRREAH